jgi:orotate phosphoribosyltransferase
LSTQQLGVFANGSLALQSAATRAAELRSDILAAAISEVSGTHGEGDRVTPLLDLHRCVGRPTILRRLANLLALALPADVDRLVSRVSGPAASITTALALECGLPFATIDTTASRRDLYVRGDLYHGEMVVQVEDIVASGGSALDVLDRLRQADVQVVSAVCVIDRGDGGAAKLAAVGVELRTMWTTDGLDLVAGNIIRSLRSEPFETVPGDTR